MKVHSCMGFDNSNPPVIRMMRFEEMTDGQLAHYIDGDLRAIVPPESFSGYAEHWPDSAKVTFPERFISIPADASGDKVDVTGSALAFGTGFVDVNAIAEKTNDDLNAQFDALTVEEKQALISLANSGAPVP